MKELNPIRSSIKLSDLKNLVKTGEGFYLEFKRTIPNPERIAREMCAFANTKGGTVLIGVDDDGSIIGIESFFEEQFLLSEAAFYLCKPELELHVEIILIKNREIAIVKVKEAKLKPVLVDIEGEWQGFIRVKDKSIRASKEMLQILKNRSSSNGITFDFGLNEQKLFRYLNEYQRITVSQFSNLVNISTRRASRILVNLVSAGVLNLFTLEKAEFFTLAKVN